MRKLSILIYLMAGSLLFGLSVKEQNKEIRSINNTFKKEGNPTRMYKYDMSYGAKTFDYSLEVNFASVDANSLNNMVKGLCTTGITKQYINKGWKYKYYYRNKDTKKKVISFTVDKSTCQKY